MRDRRPGADVRAAGWQSAAACAFGAAVALGIAACGDPHAGPEAKPPRRAAMERNADCCMCHQPFLGEQLSARHAKHGIACADCHGESRAHSTDEKFRAPPDVTFKPRDVDKYCLRCHSPHEPKRPPSKSLAVTHPKILGTEAPNRCTACHGRHKIIRAEAVTRPAKS